MLRIFSDLHVRDASSRVRSLEELAPLLDGVEELWVNGDCCDSQCGMTAADLEAIRQFFRARVPRVRFLTGNHDPDISAEHHAAAAGGRVWVTHGDVFFDDIVPWSRLRPQLRRRVAAARAELPGQDFTSVDGRLAVMRRALLGLHQEWNPEDRNPVHRIRRLAGVLFPPRQPWAMLRVWHGFADIAARHLARWRPETQVLVAGHTHYPCVRRRGGLTVVNTGAFAGPFGACCADIDGDTVRVRRVGRDGASWHAGRITAEIPLRPL